MAHRKKIDPKKIAKSQELPTTGDGRRMGRKPKPDETNLRWNPASFVAKLIRRSTDGGKHS